MKTVPRRHSRPLVPPLAAARRPPCLLPFLAHAADHRKLLGGGSTASAQAVAQASSGGSGSSWASATASASASSGGAGSAQATASAQADAQAFAQSLASAICKDPLAGAQAIANALVSGAAEQQPVRLLQGDATLSPAYQWILPHHQPPPALAPSAG